MTDPSTYINTTAKALLDKTLSIYERAILAYEFICWIHSPRGSARKEARAVALLAILEHLNAKGRKYRARSLSILEKFLMQPRWGPPFDLATSAYMANLSDIMHSSPEKTRLAQHVIDFAFRYSFTGRPRGGITMALSILRTAPFYQMPIQETQMKLYWREYQHSAVLLYLSREFAVLKHFHGIRTFGQNLIGLAKSSDEFAEAFSAYNTVVEAIEPLRYPFEPIDVPTVPYDPPLPSPPFPPDVLSAIDQYLNKFQRRGR
jgi:hypothetical protein